MAVKGKAMVSVGMGVPWEMREYPVPDPEPDAVVTKITMSSICGSDVHMYKGDFGPMALGTKDKPRILGHEFVGKVYMLGSNVKTDFMGKPLKEGDRVVWCYYIKCGRCPECLSDVALPCPNRHSHVP
ncbi:MAG: alcohol dehydrogenase catalytic domain-containing protein, partial [Dehalococcoidia bacterium]